ncbi:cytochrome P450 2J2 isoform X1 [Serinus canaria]|uniref:cytochrome P450 2J2 isoform X1 n=1 Tax=Serinus canaria TaxID=9135 RepID=UPI0021CD0067|nr:cytochrome P450 2J2 isoform X1 [Serinus canaria]
MELQFWPDFVSLLKKLNGRMLLVVLVMSLLMIDLVKKRRPRNFPPGPQLFPLVGTIVDFKQPLHLALQKLTGRYGNIFSVQFGSLTFVVVNGYQMVREALVHQAEIFADRPNIPLLQEIFRGFGLISSNGHIWRQQRKFALATLKSLAVNFEEKVQEESRYLVETIEEEKGQPFDPHYKINSAVSNIICSITFGNRFDYHDNRFQELLHSLAETLLLIGSFWGQLYNAFPSIMRWLPGPFRKIFRHWEKLQYFVKGVIAKHKEDLDQSEAGDYIDCYLKEIEKFKGDTSSYFHEENLLCSTLDLFLTGTETTATAIRWALLYMAAHPHIQEKVQQEIDAVVGQCQQPSMADKEKMPYTSAVLSEVLRMGNVVPLGVPRMATSDTTLAGFHLPKGTTLMTSLTSINFDKKVWETPDTFNPEHFLENGQYRRREAFLPFSAGRKAAAACARRSGPEEPRSWLSSLGTLSGSLCSFSRQEGLSRGAARQDRALHLLRGPAAEVHLPGPSRGRAVLRLHAQPHALPQTLPALRRAPALSRAWAAPLPPVPSQTGKSPSPDHPRDLGLE